MLRATKMRSQMGTALYGILRQVHESYTEIHARLKELKDKKVGFPMKHDETSYEDEKIWERSKACSIFILSPVDIPFNLKSMTPMANKAERDRIAKEKKALAFWMFCSNAKDGLGAWLSRSSHDCVISRLYLQPQEEERKKRMEEEGKKAWQSWSFARAELADLPNMLNQPHLDYKHHFLLL